MQFKRPSAAMLVALIALILALSTSAWAVATIDGHTIKKNSIPASRIVKHSLTGNQINVAKLGTVPGAAHAATADSATHAAAADTAGRATSADSATSADTAKRAGTATSADTAKSADTATSATHATSADSAANAAHATSADSATSAGDANTVAGLHVKKFFSTTASPTNTFPILGSIDGIDISGGCGFANGFSTRPVLTIANDSGTSAIMYGNYFNGAGGVGAIVANPMTSTPTDLIVTPDGVGNGHATIARSDGIVVSISYMFINGCTVAGTMIGG